MRISEQRPAKCSPRMCEAPGSVCTECGGAHLWCELSWWYTPVVPALRRYKQEGQKFSVILADTLSSREAWLTQHPVSDTQVKEEQERVAEQVCGEWQLLT